MKMCGLLILKFKRTCIKAHISSKALFRFNLKNFKITSSIFMKSSQDLEKLNIFIKAHIFYKSSSTFKTLKKLTNF